MKIGIAGFAGSGKTTLFNALTGQDAPTGFGGGKINLGTIKVPDHRVDRLVELDDPQKITYAEMIFADVPGGRGAQSLDPQTLGRLREMEALVQVIRGFDNGSGEITPDEEFTSFSAELILSDMQVAEKRADKLKKDRSDPRQLKLLDQCLEMLGDEKPLREMDLSDDDKHTLSGFAFLSLKPMLIVLSLPEEEASSPIPENLAKLAGDRNVEVMPLCGSIEAEISTLDPEDQKDFLKDLGLKEPASTRFIQAAFKMLNLISFLTHGPDECRAWAIPRNSTAVKAADAIHSDISRGFIRAEVIRFEDMDKLGSEAACKDAGVFNVEGKEYVVQDGDICHFRFNV